MQDPTKKQEQTQSEDKTGGDGILPNKRIPDSIDEVRADQTKSTWGGESGLAAD